MFLQMQAGADDRAVCPDERRRSGEAATVFDLNPAFAIRMHASHFA